MAKQLYTCIKGRMDDYSFYHDRLHGYLVRRTGGVTSKQYRTDQRYGAARDASSEFATISKAGKLIRSALSPFIEQVKDGTMVNRLNKELIALKQLDTQHSRGARRAETMMGDAEANKWLRIFQFNAELRFYPGTFIRQNENTWCLRGAFTDLFPEGSTHCGLRLVRTVIDFEKGCFETSSSEMVVVKKGEQLRHEFLNPHKRPAGVGVSSQQVEISCLQVLFFEERDGELLLLKGRVHGMGVVNVASIRFSDPDLTSFSRRAIHRMSMKHRIPTQLLLTGRTGFNACPPAGNRKRKKDDTPTIVTQEYG